MDEEKEMPDERNKDSRSGLMAKVKESLSQLSSKKKEVDDKYGQSISAIRDWEAEQNRKLDAVEEQIKLRYDGTVIDVAQMEQQAEMDRRRQSMLEQMQRDHEQMADFSRRLEKLKQMKGMNQCRTETNPKNPTEENQE